MNMQVQRTIIRQIVFVQTKRAARQEIVVGVPHELKAPVLIGGKWQSHLEVQLVVLATNTIMRLDEDMWIGLFDGLDHFEESIGVFLTSQEDSVPMGWVRAFSVVNEVEHEECRS